MSVVGSFVLTQIKLNSFIFSSRFDSFIGPCSSGSDVEKHQHEQHEPYSLVALIQYEIPFLICFDVAAPHSTSINQ